MREWLVVNFEEAKKARLPFYRRAVEYQFVAPEPHWDNGTMGHYYSRNGQLNLLYAML
jgi:hypothetical protein